MFLVCLVLNEVFFSLYVVTLQTQPTRPYISALSDTRVFNLFEERLHYVSGIHKFLRQSAQP